LKEYGHLLRDDPTWAARARSFSARVRDTSQLLAGKLPPGPAAGERKVTYQEACHLANAQGVVREPRQLLAALAGLELVEMREPSLCCGSAGIYNVLHPDKANQLLERKLDNALATGAPTIVTANPGCLIQLRAGLAARGSDVRARHLLDLLDEAYAAAQAAGPDAAPNGTPAASGARTAR
jgi:glycolate oxidase iron-sulfur subunit